MKTFKKSRGSDNKIDIGGYPLGRLPSWTRVYQNEFITNKRVNRYLSGQEQRILRAVEEKKYNKAVIIGLLLLKSSGSYHLVLFNQVFPQGHYILSKKAAKNLLQRINNICRSNNLGLTLRRFYILKADGKSGRPIGCPDYPSRVISKSLNQLIYLLFEDKFNKNQHGFRKHRGCHTALYNIIEKLKNKPEMVYEFDLKSYFNTVRPSGVYRSLLSRSSILAEYVAKILCQIIYELPKEGLKPEKELHDKGMIDHFGEKLPLIYREGLPQGLGISPVLSTLAMEIFSFPEELIMYADDGVFLGDIRKFKVGLDNVSLVGVQLAENKSRIVSEEFKYLGCVINIKHKGISYDGQKKSGYDEDLFEGLKRVHNVYGKTPRNGMGKINKDSYTHGNGVELRNFLEKPIIDILLIFMKGIIGGESHQGYRYYFGHGIIDFISASSEACNEIGKIKHELKLVAVKPLRPIFKNKFGNGTMIKGKPKYFEEIYENNLRNGIVKDTTGNEGFKGGNNVLENYFGK